MNFSDGILNQVHVADSKDFLKGLPESCIDLTITSPPYKSEDGYSEDLITSLFREVLRVQKNGSLAFINFGHLANFKSRPFRTAMLIEDLGFVWQETFTWVKNHYRPIQGNKRVNNLTEFIFMFSKGNKFKIDRLALGVPYKDKSNVKRYAHGRDLRCRGNVWEIPYDTVQKSEQKFHNDRFPVQLPSNCIRLSGIEENSVVLDPFAGSATTALACLDLQMNFVCIEKNPHFFEIAKKRLGLHKRKLF